MPLPCRIPFSHLATGVAFIAVGIVQFIAGIVFLFSKYIFLLAGPNFWTAFLNIAVGCILTIVANIWKKPKKRFSTRHAIRQNLLATLLTSVLVLNSTTSAVLILGEGNTLLSIKLEGAAQSSKLSSKVLTSAYVVSACSPVVCIVIAIVALSGNCFQKVKHLEAQQNKRNVPKRMKNQQLYRWVFVKEKPMPLKHVAQKPTLSSSDCTESETSRDEEELIAETSLNFASPQLRECTRGTIQNSVGNAQSPDKDISDRNVAHQSLNTTLCSVEVHEQANDGDDSKSVRVASAREHTSVKIKETETPRNDGKTFSGSHAQVKRSVLQRASFFSPPNNESISASNGQLENHISPVSGKMSRQSVRSSTETVCPEEGLLTSTPEDKCFVDSTITPSPDDSKDDFNSTFETSMTSQIGEIVQIRLNNSFAKKLSSKLVPVSTPRVPECGAKGPSKRAMRVINKNKFKARRESTFSSFKGATNERAIHLQNGNKNESGNESVPELPLKDIRIEVSASSSGQTSGYFSSGDTVITETESSIFSNDLSRVPTSGKKWNSCSSKKLLRKLRSSPESSKMLDFSDQIIDGDSLIGLSHQDLIARQLRNRSLRKSLEKNLEAKEAAADQV